MDVILARKTVEPTRGVSATAFIEWYTNKVKSTRYISPEVFDTILTKFNNI